MVTLVSYNRPLTHAARKALQEYGVESVTNPDELGRWSVIDVAETPPDEVLERHELQVDRDPEAVFKTSTGSKVVVYSDEVAVDGMEQTISPDDAIAHAESEGWKRVE